MDYTIGEVAKIINISPHTLRFYDKEGLLPFVERSESGIRRFKEEDFGKLMIIECLKKTGMPIKDIKPSSTGGWRATPPLNSGSRCSGSAKRP